MRPGVNYAVEETENAARRRRERRLALVCWLIIDVAIILASLFGLGMVVYIVWTGGWFQ
jgi:hypothetical protein